MGSIILCEHGIVGIAAKHIFTGTDQNQKSSQSREEDEINRRYDLFINDDHNDLRTYIGICH